MQKEAAETEQRATQVADGLEFLLMAEAGELGQVEIAKTLARQEDPDEAE